MSNSRKFSVISLFSGAGGMDLGFDLENFKTIWANDNDKDSCKTHHAWSGAEVVCKKIEDVDIASIPDADVVLGGFPCQGFSLAGPRKIDDKRNTLYRYFVKVIETKQPVAFVAENVKGILTLGGGEVIKAIVQDFADKGYDVQYKLLNAADYSVPQDRYRVLMVGIRKDLGAHFEYPLAHMKTITLEEAIEHMATVDPRDVCTAPYSPRFMSRNRIRQWDQVSFTIPAMAKQVALHPSSPPMAKLDKDLWKFSDPKNTRRLSWREAAVIQTFPESLEFAGSVISKYKQIGNAVPVNLARAVAKELYKSLGSALEGKTHVVVPTKKPVQLSLSEVV